MVSGVRRMNEVNPRRVPLVPGWVTVLRASISSRHVTSQLGQLSLVPHGSLNQVPALAGVKAGMLPLPGGRQHCVIPYGV